MGMYPDIQKKAQAELDAVVGRCIFPEYDILDPLPYINAMIKETLRWQPVTPIGAT
jgi:cytochrome P450